MKIFKILIFALFISCSQGNDNSTIDHHLDKNSAVNNGATLVISQSNGAGRAGIGIHTSCLDALLLDYNYNWVKACNPMNIFSNIHKGIEYQKLSFSYSIADEIGGKFIVNARGGTDISCWIPGGMCFDKTIERVGNIKIDRVVMHQGENDVYLNNKNYLYDLIYVIESFRNHLGDIPFIVGQLAQWRDDTEWFNTMILTAPDHIENIQVVTTEGLTGFDAWHFDTDSQIKLGKRYADKIKNYP